MTMRIAGVIGILTTVFAVYGVLLPALFYNAPLFLYILQLVAVVGGAAWLTVVLLDPITYDMENDDETKD